MEGQGQVWEDTRQRPGESGDWMEICSSRGWGKCLAIKIFRECLDLKKKKSPHCLIVSLWPNPPALEPEPGDRKHHLMRHKPKCLEGLNDATHTSLSGT